MSVPLLLVHGDDGFGLDQAVRAFATQIGADDRVEIIAGAQPGRGRDRSRPARVRHDEPVRHAPGRAAPAAACGRPLDRGRPTAAGPRHGAARRRAPWRWSSCAPRATPTKPPALLKRLAEAVNARGGRGRASATAPRRGELQAWIRRTPRAIGLTDRAARGARAGRADRRRDLGDRMSSAASRPASPTASCGSWPPTPAIGRSPPRTSRRWRRTRGRQPLRDHERHRPPRARGRRRRAGAGAGGGPAGAADPGGPGGTDLAT